METIEKFFRVDRREIGFIRFIFESYEGLMQMTTLNARLGVIKVIIAPGCEAEAYGLLRALRKEIIFVPLRENVTG